MSWRVYSKVINITVADSHTIMIQKTEHTMDKLTVAGWQGSENLLLRMEDSGLSYHLLLVRGCLATGKGKNVIVYWLVWGYMGKFLAQR
jgi:hypothetical protein